MKETLLRLNGLYSLVVLSNFFKITTMKKDQSFDFNSYTTDYMTTFNSRVIRFGSLGRFDIAQLFVDGRCSILAVRP